MIKVARSILLPEEERIGGLHPTRYRQLDLPFAQNTLLSQSGVRPVPVTASTAIHSDKA